MPTRSKKSVTLILVALFLCLFSKAVSATDDISEYQWFMNLARTNNGKAFCAPPTTTYKELVDVFVQFGKSHPELNGRLTDAQTLQAFAEHYPCAVRATPELGKTDLSKFAGKKIEVIPTGEYASIDMKPTAAIMHKLNSSVAHENDDLIKEITQNSGNYMPTILFSVAALFYRQGAIDDAIFWLNAARLRMMFDSAICTDLSARSAVDDSIRAMPKDLIKKQFDDIQKLRDITERVLKWDETTPYNYDHRYISLHGTKVISIALANAEPSGSLTVPRENWDIIAKENRNQFLKLMNNMIDLVQKRRVEK